MVDAVELLLVHAAEVERVGVQVSDVTLGVGKAAAAAAMTRALLRRTPALVVLYGVCGAYPARHRTGSPPVAVGGLCVVVEERLGDEGVLTPAGFQDLAALGLGDCGPYLADARHSARLAEALGGLPLVRGCTVSTCSGTDAASADLAARTGADVETMEGAAVALACRQAGVPWVQLRCVSNWTGDRDRGGWDLAGAVARLRAAVRQGVTALGGGGR